MQERVIPLDYPENSLKTSYLQDIVYFFTVPTNEGNYIHSLPIFFAR